MKETESWREEGGGRERVKWVLHIHNIFEYPNLLLRLLPQLARVG